MRSWGPVFALGTGPLLILALWLPTGLCGLLMRALWLPTGLCGLLMRRLWLPIGTCGLLMRGLWTLLRRMRLADAWIVAAFRRMRIADARVVARRRPVLVADPLIVAAVRTMADARIVGALGRVAEPAVMAEHRNVAADARVMRLRLAVIADLAVVAAFRGMNVGSGRVAPLRTALVPMMRHRPGMRTRALMAELGIVRSVPVVAVARVMRSPARMGKDRPMPDDRRR